MIISKTSLTLFKPYFKMFKSTSFMIDTREIIKKEILVKNDNFNSLLKKSLLFLLSKKHKL